MRGPRPNVFWYVFNLFRLAAVVFILWALVAQFVALASDLAEVSRSHHSLTDASPAIWTSTTARQVSSAKSVVDGVGPSLITASGPPAAPSTTRAGATASNTPDAAITLGPAVITTTPAIVRPATPAASDSPLTVVRPIKRTSSKTKRADDKLEEAEPKSGVYGLSSVPTTLGGILFSSVSHIIMATMLAFLLLAQLGIPEQWLYIHTPAFGPQSGPVWLGAVQVIIAVEGLRFYSVPVVWSAHAGLLVVGMVNSHLVRLCDVSYAAVGADNQALALILLTKRRKLPEKPAPPLYFSRTTRLLFFRSLPPCYSQLSSKEEWEELNANHAGTQIRPQALSSLGSSANQAELGQAQASARSRWFSRHSPSSPESPLDQGLTDVRRGGYPTFARGGLGAAGSQIPAGTIDRASDGKMRGLIVRPAGDRKSLDTTADAYSGYDDGESRAPSRNDTTAGQESVKPTAGLKGKRKPAPLGLTPPCEVLPTSTYGQVNPLIVRQQSIGTLRDKIHRRMERKTSLKTTQVEHAEIKQAIIPTITHTAPSAALSATSLNRPPRRSTTIDSLPSAATFGGGPACLQPAVLRAIPKRSNTVFRLPSQSARPAARTDTPPTPISKSPGTQSMFTSILPWSRQFRAPDSVEAVPKVTDAADGLTLPKQNVEFSGDEALRKEASTISNTTSTTALARTLDGQGVTRTPSASKLQKSRRPDQINGPLVNESPSRAETVALASIPMSRDIALAAEITFSKPLSRQDTLTVASRSVGASSTGRRSPNTLVKAKKRSSPLALSTVCSPPVSPSIRPQSSQGILQRGPSVLRSSMAPLDRQGSTRSTRSTRTAMGVRFDLEKRYSSSSSDTVEDAERESLLSPLTATASFFATPRSARFHIAGTRLSGPFSGTPR